MRRREFIAGLGGAAAWPLAGHAQQRQLPVIGYLGSGTSNDTGRVAAFRQGLEEFGYVEGQSVAVDSCWADGHYDRLPMLASGLVRRQVAVIVTSGGPATLAAKAATTTIPIVFSLGGDPTKLGLVASLSRLGGNLTGVTSLGGELGPKRLELMHETVPTAAVIALLVNPTIDRFAGFSSFVMNMQSAARTLGVQLQVLYASNESEIDTAFVTLDQLRAGALVISPDLFLNGRNEQLAALALRHVVPTIYEYREFVAAGGLMSYGGSLADQYRRVGIYAGRILKGEKPADLPVQQATKVALFINLKTANALGLTFPITLLGRADEVIE
jgi:putative ABC transport system substrate-binding protein